MLVDAQGNEIGAIPKAPHWKLFEALLGDDSLRAPLRDAVSGYIGSEVASTPPGKELRIDSTVAGPQVFRALGQKWLDDYAHWHAGMCAKNAKYKGITTEGMYGMMLWYVLADDRSKRWEVLHEGEKRVYRLLERSATAPNVSRERLMLLELREVLRSQLAKIDELLGNA
jgi:hypothetical protein